MRRRDVRSGWARTSWARQPPSQRGFQRAPLVRHEPGGPPAALPIFAAGSAALGAAVGRVLDDLSPAGASRLSLPVGGGCGVEALALGSRSEPGAAPGLCGLRRRAASWSRLRSWVRAPARKPRRKAGDPGVTLSTRTGPKSEAPPGHPLAKLSQCVDLGEEVILQTTQGRDPGSKVLHRQHVAYPEDRSCMR